MTLNPQRYPFIREPDETGIAPIATVDIADERMPVIFDGTRITKMEGGDIEVDLDYDGTEYGVVGPRDPRESQFDDNLAEFLSESDLDTIALDVIDGVTADLDSRNEWLSRFQKGMELLGCVESSANLGVLRHAKEVNHPIIAKALVQYQARAIAEAFPPEGPVKSLVMGKHTPEKEQQAERVSGYMNYQLIHEDRTYYTEADQGYFLLGLEGSIFKKVYRDEINGMNVSRLVMARDFIVPYSATSLETAQRYTHLLPYSQNDVRKLQVNGFYRDCDLSLPSGEEDPGHDRAVMAQDRLEGKVPSNTLEKDQEHRIYEQYLDLDLKGFEDKDERGEPTGVKLPYIAHIERDSQKVLAIYRNWREMDERRRKRIRFTHYKYLPGPGFYGLGLVHMIGGLGAAATGILRLLLVTSALAGAGGGFKTKDVKIPGSVEIEPGVYKDTEHTYEELSKGFYQPDFKQPPEALWKVLGILVEEGNSFASTSEAMTGDGPLTGPVGTMVQAVEQGSKVYSGIHKRSHMAAAEEFRQLAELNGEYLPQLEGYPYEVQGASRVIYAEDFSTAVDVVPVSDPNIFSAMQRIAVAQALLQLAQEYPDLVNRKEAVRRMVNALRVPDAEEVLIDRMKVERADAVSENALILIGRPVRAYPDQDHQAHMAVLAPVLRDQNVKPEAKAAAQGHYAEHQAYHWLTQAANAMGLPMMPVNLQADPGEPMTMQMRPEVERALSQRAATVVNKLMPPQEDPKAVQVKGELELKREKMQGELALQAEREKREFVLASAKAKRDLALQRELGFAKLAMQREQNIIGLQQQGKADDAKREQDSLSADKDRVVSERQSAEKNLEAAIHALSEGLDAVAGMAERALQGGGNAQLH